VPEVSVLEGRLLAFVRGELLAGRAAAIDADTYLFADGLINSLKIIRLIAFLENEIRRDIPDQEVVMEHFRSVGAMARRFGGSPT
jgi:acyl carrier protein